MTKSKISIAIPIHLRGRSENESYTKAITHYAKLGYPVHVCGSEGSLSKSFCQPIVDQYPNVKYYEVEQRSVTLRSNGDDDLRKKFNNSIATLPESDWYCMCGADDVASKEFFDQLETIMPDKPIMAGVSMDNPFYIVHMKTGNKYRFIIKYGQPMHLQPGVNAFSKQLKDKYKGLFYPGSGCETGSEIFFRRETIMQLSGSVVMLKGEKGVVLNTMEYILAAHKTVPLTTEEEQMLSEVAYPNG